MPLIKFLSGHDNKIIIENELRDDILPFVFFSGDMLSIDEEGEYTTIRFDPSNELETTVDLEQMEKQYLLLNGEIIEALNKGEPIDESKVCERNHYIKVLTKFYYG